MGAGIPRICSTWDGIKYQGHQDALCPGDVGPVVPWKPQKGKSPLQPFGTSQRSRCLKIAWLSSFCLMFVFVSFQFCRSFPWFCLFIS